MDASPEPPKSTFSQKVDQIIAKMGSTPPSASAGEPKDNSNMYFYAAVAIVPLVSFGLFYLILRPKDGESRNYKRILMYTMLLSLILLPVIYLGKINGYLPF